MSVVSLAAARQERGPHREGPARCTACAHEWHAVAPVGASWLECPSCHTARGLFRFGPPIPGAWHCRCGCDALAITPGGILCHACGARQSL